MRTDWIHGPRRVWRASHLALSGGAVVLAVAALGVIGAAPAQAGGDEGQLIGVFVGQPVTTEVNMPMPTVVVDVEFLNGQVDKDYNGWVDLQYAVNRLGAPLPTPDQAKAHCGVATFKLTFSQVGFGFELRAVIPGQSQEPGPWQPQSGWSWGWMPGMGSGMSRPSAPFDIVDLLVTCQSEETCQSGTVNSDGTTGSAVANTQESGTLAATGGGFPTLSCTTVGGVVSFSSNLSKTITVSFMGPLGQHPWQNWQKSVNICWGSPTEFITKSGFPAQFNPANDEFEGLLPHCGAYRPAPCVSSVWFGPWGGSVTATIQAPAGDPHITFRG